MYSPVQITGLKTYFFWSHYIDIGYIILLCKSNLIFNNMGIFISLLNIFYSFALIQKSKLNTGRAFCCLRFSNFSIFTMQVTSSQLVSIEYI